MRTFGSSLLVGSMIAIFALGANAQTTPDPNNSATDNTTATANATPPNAEVSAEQTAKTTVTYVDGKLTISANNSTFQEILDAVKKQTGVKIEGAPVVDASRITVQLGPDDPLKVLANLIYGSRFNYIIVSARSETRPEKIVLMVRDTNQLVSAPLVAAKAPVATAEKVADENAPKDDAAAAGDGAEKKEVADKKDADKPAKDKDASADDKDKQASEKDKEQKAAADVYAKAETTLPAETSGADPSIAERLANLPEGMNPALAALYPKLTGGGSTQSGQVGSGQSSMASAAPYGSYMPGSAPSVPAPWSGAGLPTTSGGQPILPNNIPPEIWNVYPPNIMDLIRNGGGGSPILVPTSPLSPGLSMGASGLWDQSIKAPTGGG